MDENELEALKEQIKNEIVANLRINISERNEWFGGGRIEVTLTYDGKEISQDSMAIPNND